MNKKIHFFKANSRLGMINLPYGEKELNLGVENGPDAVLTQEFLKDLGLEYTISEFTFSTPEEINKSEYVDVITKETEQFRNFITDNLKDDETQVIIGGDHSVVFGGFLSLFQRKDPKDIGTLFFDSHGDLHKISTSPSGNFHGIYMRALLDSEFDSEQVRNLVGDKLLLAGNLMYIGNLILEDEEINFMKQSSIKNIAKIDLQRDMENVINTVDRFVDKYNHIHVSFDIDMFNSVEVTATGIHNPNGLSFAEIEPLIEKIVSKRKNFSMDLVEVNPEKAGIDKTLEIAHKVLFKFLK